MDTQLPILQKISRPIAGTWKERMQIKRFADIGLAHDFLNKQDNNNWTFSKHDLKSGIYAFAGGQWHNVKSLDPSVLAHV